MRDPEQKPFCNRLFLKRLQEGISHEKRDLVYGARAAAVRLRGADCPARGRRPAGRCSLVEVTPWEDVDPQHLGGASVRLCLRHFRRSFDRYVVRDGVTYDRALSRWAVVRQGTDGPELCSHARYADEVTPLRVPEKMELTGKKGLGGFSANRFAADIDSMGIRSVTVNIHLNSLIFKERD